jgi:hypothetical protein
MRQTRLALLALALLMVALATPVAASALFGHSLFATQQLPISEHASLTALGAGLVTLGHTIRRRA